MSFPAQCAQSERGSSRQGGEHARTCLVTQWGETARFMQVQHMGAFAPRCAAGNAPIAAAAEEAATYRGRVPLRISRRRGLGWCCRSKGGPPWKDWKKRSCSLPRTVWEGQNASRVLDCAVVVIVVLLPDLLCVCRCVWYCLCAFQVPGSLRDYSPRYRVRPGHLSCCPEAVWFPIKTRSARHESGSAGPRTVSRLAGWLSQHAFQEGPPGIVEGSLHGWLHGLRGRLSCRAACAAILSANEKIQPAKR